MAGKQRPSFLKRQKEQKRLARAAEKRDARRLKKRNPGGVQDDGSVDDAAVSEAEVAEEARLELAEGAESDTVDHQA